MPCKVVLAAEVASSYTSEIKSEVSQKSARPKLVGFLANDDPYAEKYAQSSSKHLAEAGLDFELRQIPREELEAALVEANGDPLVSGILVYYPVYGDSRDQKLQDMVDPTKDVEGLNVVYNGKLYSNDRYLDDEKTRKAILPCTPLAVVKVLDHIGVYDHTLPYGDHLRGKTIAVVNRSEVVGRPLAALLANDGAKVYSIDINDIQIFARDRSASINSHTTTKTDFKVEDVVPECDVVITGVPVASYKMPTSLLKPGVVAVNFASVRNFEPEVKDVASIYVPSVGKVTVSMLQRNLLRLFNYQQ
ncbi:Methylenetetrahydrofolate dehydrogenase [NAD(+)] [Coemansia sp. RSA 2322]|uniref:Methylenetetrahydrofolate dehydrogenase [NAD(+)] n=1 Tax=Coemansia thaxteri TaxID=2663907 RepID=A0A9W8EHZ2_9FUNG|nr:Methylenetetrahydrofolate dehydrogenase [NAD(+)] [Coemansia thaxteri]KAJ2470588.1 Methylenetetrahydrofolate dehydrogenase [NAD(+)] [Coemansia sp. RSA 2322]KAJ2483142.1 Methylenetetrahydrofolate dehydrogenase [NAD(+)] [Coemansia sp. RSA 2320]